MCILLVMKLQLFAKVVEFAQNGGVASDDVFQLTIEVSVTTISSVRESEVTRIR